MLEQNQKERYAFVERWAKYVNTHHDKEWSKQQNVVVNGGLKSIITREEFLEMKGEPYKK